MIRSVHIERRDLPFTTPLMTGRGPVTHRVVFLVRLRTADGGGGLGEAAPLEWAGTESVEECGAALAGLQERVVVGQDPGDVLLGCPAAAAGWDQAVRDLEARRAGMKPGLLEELVRAQVARLTSTEEAPVSERAPAR